MKKLISALLAAAVLLALALPAAAVTPSFSDVSDPATAREVDVLRMLGVTDGTSASTYNPGGTLTRAQFCKMAMVIMGKDDQEPLYRTRTIFSDVTSTHWARGYVNLAASTVIGGGQEQDGTQLIRGTGNGQFHPDRAITYGEAVTILARILGYSDADAGMLWPQGYLDLGNQIELTDGLSLSSGASLTRAQAAHLFYNLLGTPQKSGDTYVNSLGNPVKHEVILGLDVTVNGTSGGIRTATSGDVLTVNGVVPQSILGQQGTLVLDSKGKVMTFLPDSSGNITVMVSSRDAGWIVTMDGTRYTIPADAKAYTADGESTYAKEWVNLVSGAQVTLYTSGGKVTGLYLGGTSATQEAVVVQTDNASAGTFGSITGGVYQYTIYKNGQVIGFDDIRRYDVATYAGGILTVCDQRVTGLYENASPNATSPTTVKVLGHDFEVLPTANVSKGKVGESVTLLLTADGKVAGMATPQEVRSTAVGVLNGGKVTLLGTNIQLDCSNANNVNTLEGQLVSVSSYRTGNQIKSTVSRLTSTSAPGAFDVKNMMLGNYTVSAGAAIYDKVGDGFVTQVQRSALTQASVPARQVVYYHLNSSNMVDAIVLDDATGDCYAYGRFLYLVPEEGGNNTITVQNSGKGVTASGLETGHPFRSNTMGGVAPNAQGKVAGYVELTRVNEVPRAAFTTVNGETWLNYNGLSIPVAEKVECYNAPAQTWYTGDDPLTEARAFSDNLTVYYDRTPDQGGKVRVVVAN